LYAGNEEVALKLNRPNRALGHIIPNEAILSGRAKEVLNLIGRIEEGVCS